MRGGHRRARPPRQRWRRPRRPGQRAPRFCPPPPAPSLPLLPAGQAGQRSAGMDAACQPASSRRRPEDVVHLHQHSIFDVTGELLAPCAPGQKLPRPGGRFQAWAQGCSPRRCPPALHHAGLSTGRGHHLHLHSARAPQQLKARPPAAALRSAWACCSARHAGPRLPRTPHAPACRLHLPPRQAQVPERPTPGAAPGRHGRCRCVHACTGTRIKVTEASAGGPAQRAGRGPPPAQTGQAAAQPPAARRGPPYGPWWTAGAPGHAASALPPSGCPSRAARQPGQAARLR